MSFLFIDSTYDISLGLLDEKLGWVDFKRHLGLKASTVIQTEVFKLLQTYSIDPLTLQAVIFVNGPGFYTGLRLSEGFSDVFEFFGVPHLSFYSYEIPFWCGVESGTWFTKAYRGEYFFYDWTSGTGRSRLIGAKELAAHLDVNSKYYVHSATSLDELSLQYIIDPVQTTDLLQTHQKEIFSEVIRQKLKREVYYFRAPEDEFKVST
ncbi:MAG TPA: hypothetical protein VNJ01_04385 [Bacteriovoracaceae bacterium]|nr:hypothetical protein [Bacteriovoracaceae bacterium]